MEEHSNGKFDVLHISIGSLGEDLVLSSLDVVDDGLLNEGDLEVEALAVDLWGEAAGEFIELDGIVTHVD
jgi:hypothetical protein